MRLNKHGDPVDGPVEGLTVAEAIADEDEGLIYLDVADREYDEAPPASYRPDR